MSQIYLGPYSKRAAFAKASTHPLLLDLILVKEFKGDYLVWEPETLWKEIELTFGTTISELNKNKVQALRSCHVVDTPYEEWNVFEKVAVSFSNSIPKFDVMQKPSPHSCATAIENMQHIREKKISEEIYRYVAAILQDEGHAYGPGPLKPCNQYLKSYVSKELQKKVAAALKKNTIPTFDGTREEDVQVAKAMSIEDFVEFDSRRLLKQMNLVLKGGN